MAKRPNVRLFLVDELRYPTVDDSPELLATMGKNLRAQRVLREHGVDFRRHYVQSAACAPSRTSLFTGQYPSLHSVTQTDGMGKTAWDPGMFWLDPDMVPTRGGRRRGSNRRGPLLAPTVQFSEASFTENVAPVARQPVCSRLRSPRSPVITNEPPPQREVSCAPS
jgi:hypothetical protein